MHLLRTQARSLDDTESAVDLGQTPAEIVFLSFTDSDLAVVASAWEQDAERLPSLRVASLAQLKHPYSVDLYAANVASRARFVLVRLLGGLDYWRYGVDELAAAARARGFGLAIVPGDAQEDARLDAASTLAVEDLRRIWGYFHEGGPDNVGQCLKLVATRIGSPRPFRAPAPVPSFAIHPAGCRPGAPGAPLALVLFYRSVLLAADTAPIDALADALAAEGFSVAAATVSSLKDRDAGAALAAWLDREGPDVVLNTTAFAARQDAGGGVLDRADAPVFQVMLAGWSRPQWAASQRGFGPADLAMNVVLPETDGRIVTRAVSFKQEAARSERLEFTRLEHRPDPSRVRYVAQLAAAWARLRRTPRAERRIACVLSDYPSKAGRAGYAVGLDTPASVLAIADRLRADGFDIGPLPDGADLMACLTSELRDAALPLIAYHRLLATLPEPFVAVVREAWGQAADDPDVMEEAFRFSVLRTGNLLVALQPDRGRRDARKTEYHDGTLPPRHGYLAFYLWLREVERVHAIVHAGTHGTLEWLPGKAVALSEDCAPEAVLGPVPVIYPFIVNNPGEAAQAKRRIAAVTVGHLTPPLRDAGSHGAAGELEGLFDEYAQAEALDPRRARLLAAAILEQARDTGLLADSGIAPDEDPAEALVRLDAWLCDVKEMRVGDGLHVFGRSPEPAGVLPVGPPHAEADAAPLLAACGEAEMAGLLAALDGRFVEPGPGGAPSRGRLDVLPTGRNLYSVDPRAVPTRTAWEIGRRTADEVVTRYLQDHGDWPRRIVLDLWGSATMRTGGDDLAQAFALMGVRPLWDDASTRVRGFEILPPARLDRPRVDVTLRISGLFRDVFPAQIALFDDAVRAVAALDEPAEGNPLAGAVRRDGAPAHRIFGGAPGQYGVGVADALAAGHWTSRDDLGDAYLAANTHAYGLAGESVEAAADFRDRVAGADAFVHVQDMAGQDVLDSDAFAEHEGGFAAAAASLGASPALYHADASRPERTRVRSLPEEIARTLRGRATNPRWLAGQMRHGHRGAAEIAETVDNLFAFAATTNAVPSRHFDLMFDATCGDDAVRAFLLDANREAARAIAERFEEARRRGFWHARRNSTAAILADMREAAA